MARLAKLRGRERPSFVLVGIIALVIAMGGGAAYAYFTTGGHGSGVAAVGTAQTVHVMTAAGTPSSSLQPGRSADLTLTLNNPNSYTVTISSISQNGSVTVVHPSGTCNTTGVSIPTQTGLSVAVNPGSSVTVHISNGASMTASSDSGCQGAAFQVPVLITVQEG